MADAGFVRFALWIFLMLEIFSVFFISKKCNLNSLIIEKGPISHFWTSWMHNSSIARKGRRERAGIIRYGKLRYPPLSGDRGYAWAGTSKSVALYLVHKNLVQARARVQALLHFGVCSAILIQTTMMKMVKMIPKKCALVRCWTGNLWKEGWE